MTTYTLRAPKNTENKVYGTAKKIAEKIETLQKEKAGLSAEIESLKKKAEAGAHKLENEVSMLRKEVKALERLLNVKEKSNQ